MTYKFTVSYVGFAGSTKESELLKVLRKELRCGAKLVETGSGYELRTSLRDLNYSLASAVRIEKTKIDAAVRAAALAVLDCSAVKLQFLPTETTKPVKAKPSKAKPIKKAVESTKAVKKPVKKGKK